MCEASNALKKLDEVITMLQAGSYKSSYEDKIIGLAIEARNSLAPRPTEIIELRFVVDVMSIRDHYGRYISSSIDGVSLKQMLTELLSYGYEQSYSHSIEVSEK